MRALLLAGGILVAAPAAACLPEARVALAAPDPVAGLDASLRGRVCEMDGLVLLLEGRGWDWTGEEVAPATLPGGVVRDAAHHFCRLRRTLLGPRCGRRMSMSLRDGRIVGVGPSL